jgi:hypothetical protein
MEGVDAYIYVFLTSGLVGSERLDSCPGRFTPGENAAGTHWIGGCVGPRTALLFLCFTFLFCAYSRPISPNQLQCVTGSKKEERFIYIFTWRLISKPWSINTDIMQSYKVVMTFLEWFYSSHVSCRQGNGAGFSEFRRVSPAGHHSSIAPYPQNWTVALTTQAHCHILGPPLWSSGQSSWLQIQRSRVWFPALPDFSEK